MLYQIVTIDEKAGEVSVWYSCEYNPADKKALARLKSFLLYLESSTTREAFNNFLLLEKDTRKALYISDCFDLIIDKLNKRISV